MSFDAIEKYNTRLLIPKETGMFATVAVLSNGRQKDDTSGGGGGGDELVNRSYRDRAADDLGHRDVTRNLSREL